MLNINKKVSPLLFLVLVLITSCGRMSGPASLFKTRSPHDVYADNLRSAGLEHTEIGRSWLNRAANIKGSALTVKIPYKETGYFAPEKTQSVSLVFDAIKGQKLNITLTKKTTVNFRIYLDVFERDKDGEIKRVAFADTAGTSLDYEVETTGEYYLRLQPELLSGGQYTISITAGPSLGFPVVSSAKPSIESFFGDGRDEGARQHEGIDIFAPKNSAAIAAANGVVTSVRENTLGGKVVFMRPEGRKYSLYYAHLNKQLVNSGQRVLLGDTLGLIGNTGNARSTPAHLHFGIYTNNGAVNPIYYVNNDVKMPPEISASLKLINSTVRSSKRITVVKTPVSNAFAITTLPANTPLRVNAAVGSWYKITTPDNQSGYVDSKAMQIATALKTFTVKKTAILYSLPDTLKGIPVAAVKTGDKIEVLGNYNNYSLISFGDMSGWIVDN